MPLARSRSRTRIRSDEGWRVLPSSSQTQKQTRSQTNLPSNTYTDTRSTPTSSTLRGSDAFSEIKIETRSEKGVYVARPQPTVRKEENGFATWKTRRVSCSSNEPAHSLLPPPYSESPSYSQAGREKGDVKNELNEQEHENENENKKNEHEHEPRTLPMYLFFLGFLCPILWIIGTFTLRPPHTDHERRPGGSLDPSRIWRLPPEEKAEAEREVERLMRR
ncbi:hypothetical protein E4T56_gene13613, partial [Termitomyces sp. T112]